MYNGFGVPFFHPNPQDSNKESYKMTKLQLGGIAVVLAGIIGFGGYELAAWRFGNGRKVDRVVTYEEKGSSSSPIIVGSSSIHFRENGGNIRYIDQFHAYYHLRNHVAVDVQMGWCPPGTTVSPTDCAFPLNGAVPAGATVANPIPAPWTLQLMDSASNPVGAMHVDDLNLPGFILISALDSKHELQHEPEDNSGDGYQIMDCRTGTCNSLPNGLGSATLTVAGGGKYPLTCGTPVSGKLCSIYIRYCDGLSACL
jgi:hypothetical protein